MTSIRLWQWMLITLVVCTLGYFRAVYPADPFADYIDHIEVGSLPRLITNKNDLDVFEFVPETVTLIQFVQDPSDPEPDVFEIKKYGAQAVVSLSDHRYRPGQRITLSGCDAPQYNGDFIVEKVMTPDKFVIKIPENAPEKITGKIKSTTLEPRYYYLVKGKRFPRNKNVIVNNEPAYQEVNSYCKVDFAEFNVRLSAADQKMAVVHQPSAMQRLFEYLKLKPKDPDNSIINFIATAGNIQGIKVRYVWWQLPAIQKILWVSIPFFIFGVFLPLLNNLLTYGKFIAPPREKAPSLWNVKSSTPESAPKTHAVSQEDMRKVEDMADSLEAQLAADAVSNPPAEPPPQKKKTEVKKLAATTTEKQKVVDNKDDNEFGRDTGDFYPTVLGHETKYKPLGQTDTPPTPPNQPEQK